MLKYNPLLREFSSSPQVDDVKGKITIPNLSEEHTDLADVDLEVTLTARQDKREAQALKDMLRRGPGAQSLRRQLEKNTSRRSSRSSAQRG